MEAEIYNSLMEENDGDLLEVDLEQDLQHNLENDEDAEKEIKHFATECDEFRKVVVPVQEDGSVGSSCGSQRSKLRLCLEMSIRSKGITNKELPDVEIQKCGNADPVKVMIDYPEDFIVTVNAKIQKLDMDILSPSDYGDVDEVDRKGWQCTKGLVIDHNDNKVLDSTFIKANAPLSSTLIYPIIGEQEANVSSKKDQDNLVVEIVDNGNKSNAANEDVSLYHTVLGDNGAGDGFGNISAIGKTDGNLEKASLNSVVTNNANFGSHPSARLNSSSLLFKSEKETPARDLAKALHVLARYHGRWGIYEDESCIEHHLRNLNRILTITDTATVLNICCDENYQEVSGLISYFTLEKRFVIRSELLQTFTLLCAKSRTLSSFIYASEIPVVLASAIANGDVTTKELYAYASYFLQIITKMQLSTDQCDNIGEDFYRTVCGMIVKADKKYYEAASNLLFDVLLYYHAQLQDTELKWQSLYSAAENGSVIKKIKSKLTAMFMRNASLSPRSEVNQNDWSGQKIKEVLIVMNDFIVCNATRYLFTDQELDVLLVTLMHNLCNDRHVEWHREAVITIHRILLTIQTKPSGLDKLDQLIIGLLKDDQNSDNSDRCYRSVLKKINKIIQIS